jgi:uncharacterized membrane protein
MQTENRIEIAGDLDQIVALAVDVERWPEILPHYRWVKLLDGGGDHKVVEMAARRGWIPVRWQAVQDVKRDGATPTITYRHIGGVTKGMDVTWTFETQPSGTAVRIWHGFQLPWPVVGGIVADRVIGPHFVAAIAGQTLATIKRLVESGE